MSIFVYGVPRVTVQELQRALSERFGVAKPEDVFIFDLDSGDALTGSSPLDRDCSVFLRKREQTDYLSADKEAWEPEVLRANASEAARIVSMSSLAAPFADDSLRISLAPLVEGSVQITFVRPNATAVVGEVLVRPPKGEGIRVQRDNATEHQVTRAALYVNSETTAFLIRCMLMMCD